MKSFTINSKIIYIIIAVVFVVYCYFSYMVFTASNSPALVQGDSQDASGNVTGTSTMTIFFSNIGWLSLMMPIIIPLIIILIFFDSS
jgi:hypothetical protein